MNSSRVTLFFRKSIVENDRKALIVPLSRLEPSPSLMQRRREIVFILFLAVNFSIRQKRTLMTHESQS